MSRVSSVLVVVVALFMVFAVGEVALADNNEEFEGMPVITDEDVDGEAEILATPISLYDDADEHVDDYSTIQAAVDAAEDDYRVEIPSGTYFEHVVVEEIKGLHLKGIEDGDRPVLDGEDMTEYGIFVNADDVEITNLEVRNFGDRGVYAYSDNILIDNVYSHSHGNDGIRVRDSIGVVIQDSESSKNDGDGISFYAYGEIINTDVQDNTERGIYHAGSAVEGQGHVTVRDSSITGNNFSSERAGGIIIYGGPDGNNTLTATVENNVVADNEGTGILIYKVNHERGSDEPIDSDHQSVVSGNTVSRTVENDHARRGAGDGILVYLSHHVDVDNNTVEDNENAGIRVTSIYAYETVYEDTTNNTVTGNTINDNHYGVLIQEGAEDTEVEDNEFSGNDIHVSDDTEDGIALVAVLEDNIFPDNKAVVPEASVTIEDEDYPYLFMSWGKDVDTDNDDHATFSADVGETFEATVDTEMDEDIRAVDRVLYVLVVKDDDDDVVEDGVFTAESDGVSVGYDEAGFWHWGERQGFTFDIDDGDLGAEVSTTFDVTFHEDGEFNIRIFAVRVPK